MASSDKSPVYNPSGYARVVELQPHSSVPPQGFETQYVHSAAAVESGATVHRIGPPIGRWRDGICDCCSNLWPSCGCIFFIHGAWIMAQMAERTGFMTFKSIMMPLLILEIFCIILSIFVGQAIFIIPAIVVLILSIMLRMHVVNTFQIRETTGCGECCIAFWCSPCSIAQMARHIYGYRKVFDGDSDFQVGDYYSLPSNEGAVPAQTNQV